MNRLGLLALLAASAAGCGGSPENVDPCGARSELRRTICEADSVSAFLLRSPDSSNTKSLCPGCGFRGFEFQLRHVLATADRDLLDATLGNAEAAPGAANRREFRPEIGLQARSDQNVAEVLISFESDSWSCWVNGTRVEPFRGELGSARDALLKIVSETFPEERGFEEYHRPD